MKKTDYQLKPLFFERMQLLLSNEKDFNNYLKILKKPVVNFIRCNTLKISPEKLKKRLENKGWKIEQPFKKYPEIMIVEGKFAETKVSDMEEVNKKKNSKNRDESNEQSTNYKNVKQSSPFNNISKKSERQGSRTIIPLEPGELGRSLEHLLGYYYIQEIASMLPIIALKPKPNEIILDLCAAPGSKTTQMSAFMKNKGTIIANDISLSRIKILASNLERCGCSNIIITKKEGFALCQKFIKQNFQFDKILLDVPCSGEGTLRNNPKTALMWNVNSIKKFSWLQKKLIVSALKILGPNGILVYSTCTHAPEENEEVIDFALRNFKNIKIESTNLPVKCRQGITKWQNRTYVDDVKKLCRIYPQDNNTGGFFIAKLRKVK